MKWLFKYKLYHLPFWFLYHWMWWTLLVGDPWKVVGDMVTMPWVIKSFLYFFFEAAGVYFNLYYLMPKFLDKGKYLQYCIFVILTIIITAICIVPGYYATAWYVGKTTEELFNITYASSFFKINTLPSATAAMTLGMSVKLAKKWIETKKRERMLEQEKIETELKFLKSQFNPHFIFNTINSIFVLIRKDPEVASASLARFSDLLRYQLYECNEHRIPLQQEVSYLKNFMELEELRQEKNVQVTATIDPQLPADQSIAPFILMPFMENAFKHVSRCKDGINKIELSLHTSENTLNFEISNSIDAEPVARDVIKHGGIGLTNVRRRLELLYPGQHELTIQKDPLYYRVLLRLQLIHLS